MIEEIRNVIIHGGDQALAASRGEGKTKLFERMLLKYTLSGAVKFAVLFAASGAMAESSLQSMRDEIERNERLCADYPEVCVPVRALEDTPNRAHYQLVTGKRHDNGKAYEAASSRFTWCGHEIIYPNVPGSPAAWGIIATRGLDAAVRGLSKKNRRPEVVGIDDPDTEDTVRSLEQAQKLEERIDRGIAGLGGQQRGVARIMLTTLQRPECVSAWFTDPKKKPSWKGKRFRFLVSKPERMDLWEEYIERWRLGLQSGDSFYRDAHNFFLSNREEMERGSEVANPHRFNSQVLPDGSQLEVSSLQRYFNEVARIGQAAVSTEYDNDPPPDDAGILSSGITPRLIQRQLSGVPRKVIPAGCTVLTHTCDVGKLKGFNWVVRAWKPDGTGFTIDYGVMSVIGAKYGSDEGLDVAICNSVIRRMDEFKAAGYAFADGSTIRDSISTFDARWKMDAVLTGVKKAGVGVYGLIGIGQSAGCVSGRFRDVLTNSATRRKCGTGGAYEELHTGPYGRLWVIHADADRWKGFEHDRWMTAKDKPGCLFLFGESSGSDLLSADERAHEDYARQICAEIEVEENHKRKWITKGKENDWLDASWHSCCAAAVKGIRVFAGVEPRIARARRSLAELQQQARSGG